MLGEVLGATGDDVGTGIVAVARGPGVGGLVAVGGGAVDVDASVGTAVAGTGADVGVKLGKGVEVWVLVGICVRVDVGVKVGEGVEV